MRMHGITHAPECSSSTTSCAPRLRSWPHHQPHHRLLRRPASVPNRAQAPEERAGQPQRLQQQTTLTSAQHRPAADGPDSGSANNVVASPPSRAAVLTWQLRSGHYSGLVERRMQQTGDLDLELFGGVGSSATKSLPLSAAARARQAAAVADLQQRRTTARIKASSSLVDLREALLASETWATRAALARAEAASAQSPQAAAAAPALAVGPAAVVGPWAGMDAICISAAFSQLPKLLRGRRLPDAERRDIAALASLQLLPAARAAMLAGRFDAHGLVSVAVGLAKLDGLGGPEAAHVARLLVDCCQPLLNKFTPQGLSNLIWALATLEVQPCGAWLTHFYAAVEAATPDFNGQDVANTLWGLGRFDLMPETELLELLLTRFLAHLEAPGGGRDAATVITCIARYCCKYNYKPREEWTNAFMALTQPNLRGFSPSDLVSVVHSLVCCNVLPRRAWMITFYDVLKDRLIFDPSLAYNDFSRLLGSLSRIDYTPSPLWLKEFVDISAPKLSHLRYRALSELVWALACWDCKPNKAWLKEFLTATTFRLDDFRPRQLAIALAALSHLSCKVPSAWLDRVLKHFVKNIGEAKAHDLVDVLESVSICEDAAWLMRQSATFNLLADTAAAKFSVFDAGMHVRLVVALARVQWGSPSAAWLAEQQAALLSCWRSGDDVDTERTAGLRSAYASWEAEMDCSLEAEMMRASAGGALPEGDSGSGGVPMAGRAPLV